MTTRFDPYPDGDWFVVNRRPGGSAMVAKVWVTDLVLTRDVEDDIGLLYGARYVRPTETRVRLQGVLDEAQFYDPGAAVRFEQPALQPHRPELDA